MKIFDISRIIFYDRPSFIIKNEEGYPMSDDKNGKKPEDENNKEGADKGKKRGLKAVANAAILGGGLVTGVKAFQICPGPLPVKIFAGVAGAGLGTKGGKYVINKGAELLGSVFSPESKKDQDQDKNQGNGSDGGKPPRRPGPKTP
jgi:hypothetical protein